MKRMIATVLALVMAVSLTIPAMAYTPQQQNTADALNTMGLFLGYGNDAKGNPQYGLDNTLTRAAGLILLLRMLGEEEAAKACKDPIPFTDAKGTSYECYVAYAYKNGITNGFTATSFGGKQTMSGKQFAAFCLRALGYSDSGANKDFAYADSIVFADDMGIAVNAGQDFDRGDVVTVLWQALHAKMKGENRTMAENLQAKGVFTAADYTKAEDIQRNGKTATSGSTTSSGSGSSGGNSSGNSGSNTPSVPACTHSSTKLVVTKDATCKQSGLANVVCTSCGAVISANQTVPANANAHLYIGGSCAYCGTKQPGDTHYQLPDDPL